MSNAKLTLDYKQIKSLVFQLPVTERLELYQEIRKRDWSKDFDIITSQLAKKAEASRYKAKDIASLVKQVRKTNG